MIGVPLRTSVTSDTVSYRYSLYVLRFGCRNFVSVVCSHDDEASESINEVNVRVSLSTIHNKLSHPLSLSKKWLSKKITKQVSDAFNNKGG